MPGGQQTTTAAYLPLFVGPLALMLQALLLPGSLPTAAVPRSSKYAIFAPVLFRVNRNL